MIDVLLRVVPVLEAVRRPFDCDTCKLAPHTCPLSHRDVRSQVMTVSIVAGWSLLVYTLGQWSSLGYVEGAIAGAFPGAFSPLSRSRLASQRGISRALLFTFCSHRPVRARVRTPGPHSRTESAPAVKARVLVYRWTPICSRLSHSIPMYSHISVPANNLYNMPPHVRPTGSEDSAPTA